MTDADARARVAKAVPANVREVCATLIGAGHEAVTVGGAVRDALLGRTPGDWDVATSARPEQVIALFKRTVPTGLQHGTVTIVTGKGIDSHVEVTTFRGEGAYSDARRPDHVVFGVPLVEDLARRDLVVNAIAYDPVADAFHDPFGGRDDIANRRLRAVGTPVDRFTEDGLRVMRAVRFAAVLEFELDPDTEAAIGPALPSLAKVSRERVADELHKLLAARQPSRGLRIAERTGIIAQIVPAIPRGLAAWNRDVARWLSRVDAAPVDIRMAAMLADLADPTDSHKRLDRAVVRQVDDVLRGLKLSNEERELTSKLVGVAAAGEADWAIADVRRLLADIGRVVAAHAIDLWRADSASPRLIITAGVILGSGHALSVGELAVGGKDLMDALALPPGPLVGKLLAALMDRVLDDPALNTREALVALAEQLRQQLGGDR
jgi:tRNA nucleotidyltransferase (CCA-adding enzyme)